MINSWLKPKFFISHFLNSLQFQLSTILIILLFLVEIGRLIICLNNLLWDFINWRFKRTLFLNLIINIVCYILSFLFSFFYPIFSALYEIFMHLLFSLVIRSFTLFFNVNQLVTSFFQKFFAIRIDLRLMFCISVVLRIF